MTSPEILLAAKDVAKRFESVVALKAASLEVRAGEVHALMGANGAGKSTLVKVLTGVFPADSGEMVILGEARRFRSPAEARQAGIVSVYQDPALVPDLTVAQNLRLARVGIGPVREWLVDLGIPELDFSAFVRDLPDPVLRLIDLGRALASDPQLLLIDEITAALPANVSERIFALLRRWRDRGRSVIFISHRMAEVSALCDRATVLRDGTTVGVTETARGSEERIVELMLGYDVAHAAAASTAGNAGRALSGDVPALEVRGLRCGRLLNDVSFALRAGEVLGIVALEGQGQEQLFDCLAGVRDRDSGEIAVRGRAQRFRHPGDAIRAGVVLVPPNRQQAMLPQRSIRENVALPAYRDFRHWGLIDMRAEGVRVEKAIRRLQVDTRAESALLRLSGGNQQKVMIARWLASEFRTLLCYDPTRGIDIGTKRQIYTLVRELAAGGAAVLLFTSELPEIPLACDRVIVLFAGRVVHEMPAADADEAILLRASHGLITRREAEA
jgi:ribose transport system ATP-binding protein